MANEPLKPIFDANAEWDQKSLEFLMKALDRNNQAGFDYLEFKQSLLALYNLNIDVPTAFKSAYATASTVGLTKDKLLSTAEQYKQVLYTEKAQFDVALKNQIQQKVDAKKLETDQLKNKIIELKENIRKLEAEIESSKSKVDNADKEISDALSQIESTKKRFETTFAGVIEQIEKDIALVRQYL